MDPADTIVETEIEEAREVMQEHRRIAALHEVDETRPLLSGSVSAQSAASQAECLADPAQAGEHHEFAVPR